MELIFQSCGDFRRRPEGPDSQIHSPHLPLGQGSSTRGPRASFVGPGKGSSQNTMRYEY